MSPTIRCLIWGLVVVRYDYINSTFRHVTKEILIIRELESNLRVGLMMRMFEPFKCLKTRRERAQIPLKWALVAL